MVLKMRVAGVPEHFNTPWHLAKEKGLFSAAGVDLEWTDYPGGTGAMTKALNENETDLALLLTGSSRQCTSVQGRWLADIPSGAQKVP